MAQKRMYSSIAEAFRKSTWFFRGGQISFKALDFSGAQFYFQARSGMQKSRCSKPNCTSDRDTTRNIAFCSLVCK